MAAVLGLNWICLRDDLRIGSIKETGDARPLLSQLAKSGPKYVVLPLDRVAAYFSSLGAFHSLAGVKIRNTGQ